MSAPPPEVPFAPVLEALRAGRLDEAARGAEALMRGYPRDARAHALAARCGNARGLHAEAEAAIARALALDADCVPALIEQAQLARARQDHAASLAALERLAALQPGHAGLLFDLGVARARLGREEEAVAAFERVLALAPGLV